MSQRDRDKYNADEMNSGSGAGENQADSSSGSSSDDRPIVFEHGKGTAMGGGSETNVFGGSTGSSDTPSTGGANYGQGSNEATRNITKDDSGL